MEILLKVVQVILALSLLVVVHEFGHFIFARIFHTRVEKFYLFFNPRFSLVKFKKFGGRLHCRVFSSNEADEWADHPESTEFGIGWVPFGGYCAIAGMIDETTKKSDLSERMQPWEFRTKPAWQRFFIMFGGVLMNFILAAALYSAILGTWGEEYLRNEDAVYGIAVNDLSYEMGFRDGDRILSFDGEPVDDFATLQIDLIRSKATEAVVLRGNDTVCISIDPVYIPAMLKTPGMFTPAFPFVVGEVAEGSINYGSGLQSGDAIIAVGGSGMSLVQQIKRELQKYASAQVEVTVLRDGSAISLPLTVDSDGMIQVTLDADPARYFHITRKEYGLLSSIPAGISKMWSTIVNYVKELGLIFSPQTKAYKSVGSFIAIGKIFPSTWDWYKFWSISALLSIILGVMNLLPIPALDGGHILFLVVEMITGRKPSDRFLEVAETIGIVLLIALMVLAFGNDIRSLF